MNPPCVPFSLVLAASVALGCSGTTAAEIPLNGHVFTLTDGFTIERVPGTEAVPRPISASFDRSGALYVTDSAGLNLPPAEQLKDPKSRILRLEDADHDGRYEKVTVFADRVMFPQGCLWYEGSVYVAGPPSIWKFTDTDGDGVADKREEWFQGKVLTGCANDIHGPYLGPDAMIYWTKGAFERLDLKDHRGRPIQDRCAHIFRSRPDGSGLEMVMSGGMDNPVEVAFTSEGEPIVISTFIDLSQPGRRDGLGHAVYGGVFGKINGVVDEPMVKRTGDLMPAMTQFGPAAACALMRYQGDGLGAAYKDNLFATLFNLRKVTRHVLQPKGASFATLDSDFLVSDQMDFHPTDVLQDVDGSLLVVDTGGWYKLCCPSSQLAKADVLGAIYRIRRAGPALTVPDRAAAYARLIGPPTLQEENPVTRLKRVALKADPGEAAGLREALVRNVPLASASPESARLARVAAEGLGRMQDRASVPVLFQSLAAVGSSDRFLEHSLLYALIEMDHAEGVRPFLGSADPTLQRAALLVLDQVRESRLKLADVAPALRAGNPTLRETAQWVARRHPEWSGELAGLFRSRLEAGDVPDGEKADWERLLPLLLRSAEGRGFLAQALTAPGFRDATRVAALRAMSEAGGKEVAPEWRSALAKAAGSSSEAVASAALAAIRSLPMPKEGDPAVTSTLRALAGDAGRSRGIRLEALSALPAGSEAGDAEWGVLKAALSNAEAGVDRTKAVGALSRIQPSAAQRDQIVEWIASARPLELSRLVAALAGPGDAAFGERALTALRNAKGLRALRPDDLRATFSRYPDAVRQGVDELLASMNSDASRDRERLDAVLAEIQKLDGSVRRGQAIFNSPKAACSTCHRLGYLGGNLGPDLTAIGTSRAERDLLEAVLYPSASFVRSYEPWIAVDNRGEEVSGVIRSETPEDLVIAAGPTAEVRIARADLKELRPGQLSVMPAGLEEQLSRQDLADLIAFLKNTKWGAN